jgi:hypothetical protein
MKKKKTRRFLLSSVIVFVSRYRPCQEKKEKDTNTSLLQLLPQYCRIYPCAQPTG